MVSENILKKWEVLINACKAYYVDNVPTGMSDSDFDELEARAVNEDKFFARDYVFELYIKGTRTKNEYIGRIKKKKVTGMSMMDAIEADFPENESGYAMLKLDGSSLAIYIDPNTGIPKRVVTVGNLNIDDFGVDQTWKLLSFLPKRFPLGIVAIQAEALVDVMKMDIPEKARQKANGLVTSTRPETQVEVTNLLTIRAVRYFTDDSDNGKYIRSLDFRNVMRSFDTVKSVIDGRILFAPADIWTVDELKNALGYTETGTTETLTGKFLNDGWVTYTSHGTCKTALKYAKAGNSSEIIKTVVNSIQWNSQVSKNKDSWSANIIVNPVQIGGCTIRKPSAGSVKKLIEKSISPGAVVEIILANSTIPMCGEVFEPGNNDFMWPTCTCGYSMSEKDIFGSLLKCGNTLCTERFDRMTNYLGTLINISVELDLNKFLVIDRFKWETTGINICKLLKYVEKENIEEYYKYLLSFIKTDLQKRNLDLVVQASYAALLQKYKILTGKLTN